MIGKTPNLAQIHGRENYRQFLLKQQPFYNPNAKHASFPHSDGRANPDQNKSYLEYQRVLNGYEYFQRGTDKQDHIKDNTGHKLHLNVTISHVMAVSEYLKQNAYYHKFLEGGTPVDGKIFTIYIGSFELAFSLAAQISIDLDGMLSKPHSEDKDEIEYAPNVCGRFRPFIEDFSRQSIIEQMRSPKKAEFNEYGHEIRGICSLSEFNIWNPAPEETQFEESYNRLADIYGEYFHG
ncbi:MAG: hypothetical protein ABIE74_02550 [Pseudomonadota bacterium]